MSTSFKGGSGGRGKRFGKVLNRAPGAGIQKGEGRKQNQHKAKLRADEEEFDARFGYPRYV